MWNQTVPIKYNFCVIMYIFERGETAEGRCKNQLRHYMIRQISSSQAYPTAGASQTSYLVFAQWMYLSDNQ